MNHPNIPGHAAPQESLGARAYDAVMHPNKTMAAIEITAALGAAAGTGALAEKVSAANEAPAARAAQAFPEFSTASSSQVLQEARRLRRVYGEPLSVSLPLEQPEDNLKLTGFPTSNLEVSVAPESGSTRQFFTLQHSARLTVRGIIARTEDRRMMMVQSRPSRATLRGQTIRDPALIGSGSIITLRAYLSPKRAPRK